MSRMIVVAQRVSFTPDFNAIPGAGPVQQLINGIGAFALLLSLVGIIIGGAMWGVGSLSSNYHQAAVGKRATPRWSGPSSSVGGAPELRARSVRPPRTSMAAPRRRGSGWYAGRHLGRGLRIMAVRDQRPGLYLPGEAAVRGRRRTDAGDHGAAGGRAVPGRRGHRPCLTGGRQVRPPPRPPRRRDPSPTVAASRERPPRPAGRRPRVGPRQFEAGRGQLRPSQRAPWPRQPAPQVLSATSSSTPEAPG
jgi:hypothetical protein